MSAHIDVAAATVKVCHEHHGEPFTMNAPQPFIYAVGYWHTLYMCMPPVQRFQDCVQPVIRLHVIFMLVLDDDLCDDRKTPVPKHLLDDYLVFGAVADAEYLCHSLIRCRPTIFLQGRDSSVHR